MSAEPKPKLVIVKIYDLEVVGLTVMLVSESIGCPVPRLSTLPSVVLERRI